MDRKKVVIAGGGFGGLSVARALKGLPIDITLVDRQNHHCFQPLLYQVATAVVSPADIAWPIRHILRNQANIRVVMADVLGVDVDAKLVKTDSITLPYDYLVLATGATNGPNMRRASRRFPMRRKFAQGCCWLSSKRRLRQTRPNAVRC